MKKLYFLFIILFCLRCTRMQYIADLNFGNELQLRGFNYRKINDNNFTFDLYFYVTKKPTRNWYFSLMLSPRETKTLLNAYAIAAQQCAWWDIWPGVYQREEIYVSEWKPGNFYMISIPFYLNIDKGVNSVAPGIFDIKLAIMMWERQNERDNPTFYRLPYINGWGQSEDVVTILYEFNIK